MEYGFLLRVSVQPEMHDVIIPDVYSLVPRPSSNTKSRGAFQTIQYLVQLTSFLRLVCRRSVPGLQTELCFAFSVKDIYNVSVVYSLASLPGSPCLQFLHILVIETRGEEAWE